MSSLSTFQTLPLHIAEAIAHYCISNYRMIHPPIDLKKHSRRTWGALYNVSNIWRALALRYYCKVLYVRLLRKPHGEVSFVDLPPSIEVHKHFYNYVKSLTLDLRRMTPRAYSAITERYDKVWPKDVTLRSASLLSIHLDQTPGSHIDNKCYREKKNIVGLLQRIRISIPKLRQVEIGGYNGREQKLDNSPYTEHPKLDSLFVDILTRARKLEVQTWPALLSGEDAQLLNGSLITSLSYTIRGDMGFFAIVLWQIGPTLESLEIKEYPLHSIRALMFGRDGNPIVYSRLRTLCFHTRNDMCRTAPSNDLSATPFPSLRYLKWISDYPFDDGLLFQGCCDTLEYLHVRLDSIAIHRLGRYDLALSGRCTRLRHLFVEMVPYQEVMASEGDRLLKFGASLISSGTQTFSTKACCSYQQAFSVFSTCSYAENIRVLSLEGTRLCLLEIMNLIKLLPNMSDFACRFIGQATDAQLRKDPAKLNIIHSKHYPLSRRLKCCRILEAEEATDVAIVAITLAVLCPRFTFVAAPFNWINEYQAKLKEAIESVEYSGYRDKIKPLISDLWEQ